MIFNDGIIRVALYRSKAGNWFDGAINAFSGGGGFSHCEVCGFPGGLSFSSTSRDSTPTKKDGTRWKQIDFDPDKWAIFVLDDVDADAMAKYANSILAARYDFSGALALAPVLGWFQHQDPTRYFCSEAVIEVCQSVNIFNGWQPYRFSPNLMAKELGLK